MLSHSSHILRATAGQTQTRPQPPMIVSHSVYMVRHPRGSHIVYPLLSLKSPHQKTIQFIGRCHPYARKFASKAVLSRMQVTLHATRPTPHGASRLVQAMPAWSVKTRRAPSGHYRDARVYGHTTTAMHNMSPHPPALPVYSPTCSKTAASPLSL